MWFVTISARVRDHAHAHAYNHVLIHPSIYINSNIHIDIDIYQSIYPDGPVYLSMWSNASMQTFPIHQPLYFRLPCCWPLASHQCHQLAAINCADNNVEHPIYVFSPFLICRFMMISETWYSYYERLLWAKKGTRPDLRCNLSVNHGLPSSVCSIFRNMFDQSWIQGVYCEVPNIRI